MPFSNLGELLPPVLRHPWRNPKRRLRLLRMTVLCTLIWIPLTFRSSRVNTHGGVSSSAPLHDDDDDDDDDWNNFPNPVHLKSRDGRRRRLDLPPPVFGAHRPDADAVFAIAAGYGPEVVFRFVHSLIATGYDGDIVLGMASDALEELVRTRTVTADADADGAKREENVAFRRYLEHHARHHHLVIHGLNNVDCEKHPADGAPLCLWTKMYRGPDTNGPYLPDIRVRRHISQSRFEFYWAWTLQYGRSSRIFLLDSKDVFFQRPPFVLLPPRRRTKAGDDDGDDAMERTLHVFEEDPYALTLQTQRANSRWVRESRGEAVLQSLGDHPIVCSGSTLGGRVAVESYLRAQIMSFDETQCLSLGCDQGQHNYILRSGRLMEQPPTGTVVPGGPRTREEAGGVGENGAPRDDGAGDETTIGKGKRRRRRRIENLEFIPFQHGTVQTLGLVCNFRRTENIVTLASLGMLDTSKRFPTLLSADKTVTPVIHQYNRCDETRMYIQGYGMFWWEEWKKKVREEGEISYFI